MLVEALKRHSGNVQFTVYPEAEHDAWSETYANPQVYQWLLDQKRTPSQTCRMIEREEKVAFPRRERSASTPRPQRPRRQSRPVAARPQFPSGAGDASGIGRRDST